MRKRDLSTTVVMIVVFAGETLTTFRPSDHVAERITAIYEDVLSEIATLMPGTIGRER